MHLWDCVFGWLARRKVNSRKMSDGGEDFMSKR